MKTLVETLEEAQKYKFLGPLPIEDHLKNGEGFLEVIVGLSSTYETPHRLVDLGSGGGVPAFVIADKLPHWQFLLVERKENRAEFLSWSAQNMKFGSNIEVFLGEAEMAARNRKFEQTADFVTARSFAPPPKTAECGCRFLKKGGFMVVSEPPNVENRWPKAGLSLLGLEKKSIDPPKFGTFEVLQLHQFPDKRYPRSPSAINKRALW